MTTLITCVLWLVGVLVILAMFVLMCRLTGYLNRPDKVVVGEFLDNGQPKPGYATKFYDRWLNFRSAGLGLEKAGADLPFLTGGDFVMAEIEQRTGNELEKAIGELAKEVDIKVAGVSLQGFAKFLDSMTPRPSRTIEGRFNRFGNEITLTVTLRHRKKTEKVWSSTKTIESDAELPTAIEDLIDEAICQVAIHLRPTDPTAVSKGANSMHSIAQLKPSAIASLTKGRRSLSRYIRDNKQSDLLAAQRHFRSLVDSSPAFPEGYMMLAYTLAENRQEREAVEMYDRVVQFLSNAGAKKDIRSYEAQFLKACSLLRCYRWKDAVQAINEFHELADELEKQTVSQEAPERGKKDAWRYNKYLLARCYAELGHCLGHLIVFLPKDKPLSDDHRSALDDLKKKDILKELTLPAQGKDQFADRAKVAGQLYHASDLFKKSSEKVADIKEEWLAELRARLSEVAGYALFRFAEWLDISKSAEFREKCTKAIGNLQDAELRKPRNYGLLQNIAMILLSRRYDPDGVYLVQAGVYCQRSVELKPNDYYGHEQLARFNLRRMLAVTGQEARDEAARMGEEAVAKAQKIDFQKRGPVFLGFYFRLAKLALQGAGVKPSDVEPLLSDIDRYEPSRNDPTYRWMRLHCYLLLLLATPDETAFNAGKGDLDNRLTDYDGKFKDQAASNWRTSQMLNSVQRLQIQLAKATYKTRADLKFELEAALD